MPAQRPEDVDNLFAKALNAGDLDALTVLYEPQASLTPSPGIKVTGTAAIRDALAKFVAGKPHITLTPRVVAQAGDVALVTASWRLTMTGPDGKLAEMTGQSLEVVRRQAGGHWCFVIDEPFGAGA